jgi:hypothetical protein
MKVCEIETFVHRSFSILLGNHQIANQSEQQLNVKTNPVHDLLRVIAQTCNRGTDIVLTSSKLYSNF